MTQTRAALERALIDGGFVTRDRSYCQGGLANILDAICTALAQEAAGDGVKESDGGTEGRASEAMPNAKAALSLGLNAQSETMDGAGTRRVGIKPGPSGPTPDVGAEPVAWRYQPNDGATVWGFSETKPDFSQGAYWTVQPLYLSASPASPPAVVPGMLVFKEIERVLSVAMAWQPTESGPSYSETKQPLRERLLALYPAPTFRDGVEAAAKRAFRAAQNAYREEYDNFPLKLTWDTATEDVRECWRSIVKAVIAPPVAAGSERDDG